MLLSRKAKECAYKEGKRTVLLIRRAEDSVSRRANEEKKYPEVEDVWCVDADCMINASGDKIMKTDREMQK